MKAVKLCFLANSLFMYKIKVIAISSTVNSDIFLDLISHYNVKLVYNNEEKPPGDLLSLADGSNNWRFDCIVIEKSFPSCALWFI